MVSLPKREILLGNGTYNKNYSKVRDARFMSDDFFDPMDIVQVKYEMIKDVVKNGKAISDAAGDFGFSRTAYYNIKDAFEKQGITGLIPEKPGPKEPHKLKLEYQKKLDELITQKPEVSSNDLAILLSEGNAVHISKRTVERYRAKKKQF